MGNLYKRGNFGPYSFISIQMNLYKRGSGEWGTLIFKELLTPYKMTSINGGGQWPIENYNRGMGAIQIWPSHAPPHIEVVCITYKGRMKGM